MWVEIKKVQGLKAAQEWKERFENEAVPTRILPVSGKGESATYLVLVPKEKDHIIEEVLRKL